MCQRRKRVVKIIGLESCADLNENSTADSDFEREGLRKLNYEPPKHIINPQNCAIMVKSEIAARLQLPLSCNFSNSTSWTGTGFSGRASADIFFHAEISREDLNISF
jgi:hypothetical protein